MAGDRRAELVEAGLVAAASLRFDEVMAAVETRAVAEAVGVTTGSFFHHFRSRTHFAEAVLDRWLDLWSARVSRLAAHAVAAADGRGHGGLRDAAAMEWAALSQPGPMESIQHVLWGLRDQPVVDGSSRTGRDLLGEGYRQLGTAIRSDYERGMRAMGREPMPPFTQHEMEVMTTALAEGLQLRAGVDPDAVRPDLYGDAIAAVMLGATRPRRDRRDDGPEIDLARLRLRLGGTADEESGEEVGAVAPERWRQIADAAAHLFVDRSPHEVRWGEISAACGFGGALVQQEFESITEVAACSWVRHVPELDAIASPPLADDEDPLRRIEQLLHRYTELIRQNRGAGEALVSQVLSQVGAGGSTRRDLRTLVPVPAMLEPSIHALRRTGRLRRRIEITRLARSIVHLVSMQALLFPAESTRRVVDETMTMVFDGALVEPSDA